jgi:NitT/TauT family transport system permease protein
LATEELLEEPSNGLRRVFARTRSATLPIVAIFLLLVVWEMGVRIFSVPEYMLPAPTRIIEETIQTGGVVGINTLATLKTVLLGFFLAVMVSLPLAVAVASSPICANAIYPLLVLTQSVPKVALAPILVVALGPGESARVFITFLVAFFPLVISTATGLIVVPKEILDLGRSLRATKLQELFLLRLPNAVPFVFSGLKLAITFSVVGATVGEFVAAEHGLGYQIISATAFLRTPLAFSGLLILSAMGIILFQAIVIVERIFFPWATRDQLLSG